MGANVKMKMQSAKMQNANSKMQIANWKMDFGKSKIKNQKFNFNFNFNHTSGMAAGCPVTVSNIFYIVFSLYNEETR